MNLLPWLLDWSPEPAAVGVLRLLTAFGVGSPVAFGGVTDETSGGNVTVEATDLSVTLNDEVNVPDGGNGTVRTCLGVGILGDRITVRGGVTVDVPIGAEDRLDGDRTVLTVSLAHTRNDPDGHRGGGVTVVRVLIAPVPRHGTPPLRPRTGSR